MRRLIGSGLLTAVLFAVSAGSAAAYENFVPMGTGYSTEVDSLPSFQSERGQVSVKTDVYESEIYRKGREAAEFDSQFRRFQSDAEFEGGDTFIDY